MRLWLRRHGHATMQTDFRPPPHRDPWQAEHRANPAWKNTSLHRKALEITHSVQNSVEFKLLGEASVWQLALPPDCRWGCRSSAQGGPFQGGRRRRLLYFSCRRYPPAPSRPQTSLSGHGWSFWLLLSLQVVPTVQGLTRCHTFYWTRHLSSIFENLSLFQFESKEVVGEGAPMCQLAGARAWVSEEMRSSLIPSFE